MLKLWLIAFLALPLAAGAAPYVSRAGVPDARAISDVPVTLLGIPLYTAALLTPSGRPFRADAPHALELTYARSFSRARLVRSTVAELARLEGPQPDHAAIEAKLATCLKPVAEGDRLAAIAPSAARLTLAFNGAPACTLTERNIGARFLAIWLSPNSRSAATSRKLKGL
ncbi:hypothetical protein [uncultured Lentibacter sp.]|uniref:hypothetical protein n=1 Tax=uncultured Lentibacter sp. TaxID=1659309 RepID=UPI002613A0C8|nr:hypothetical protein [uncultured Lentibacter sp.]